jgi:hypothetical protein
MLSAITSVPSKCLAPNADIDLKLGSTVAALAQAEKLAQYSRGDYGR